MAAVACGRAVAAGESERAFAAAAAATVEAEGVVVELASVVAAVAGLGSGV